MIAKVGLRFRDVRDGPRPGLAQFRDEFGRIDPSPRRKCGFPRLEFGVSGIRHAKSKMLFRLGLRLLFGLRRPFQSFRYCSCDEVLEHDDVLDIFGNGPSLGVLPEVPLFRSQTIDQFQQPRFTGSQMIQDKLPLVRFHLSHGDSRLSVSGLLPGAEFRVHRREQRRARPVRFLIFGDFCILLQGDANFVESLEENVLSEFIDLETAV